MQEKKICYKYVATVVKVISKTEVEVQYFEASDEENTEFVLVKGDVSVVELEDLVYKLPMPELCFKNRQYLSVFPGIVDVYENLSKTEVTLCSYNMQYISVIKTS